MATQEHIAQLAAMKVEPGDACPRDRVCPTCAEFYTAATENYNFWTVPSTESQEFDIERYLLDLLTEAPAFTFNSKQRLSWVDGEWLHLKCKSEGRTTNASACDVKVKNLTHYARPGLSTSIIYQHEEALTSALSLGFGASPNMSCLIQALCYILSCRWVERLVIAGQNAQLWQPTRLTLSNFWETIVAGEWHAVVIPDNSTYHAPWSWSKNASTSQ